MKSRTITEKDQSLAQKCVACPVCDSARKKQKGFLFWAVKMLEGACPACRAYEKVYGRKAHEQASGE